MDDVNIHIEELLLEQPVAGSDPRDMIVRMPPPADQLGMPVIAEICRAVSAKVSPGLGPEV